MDTIWHLFSFVTINFQGAWQAQSVEHEALDLGVMRLSPMLCVEITLKN